MKKIIGIILMLVVHQAVAQEEQTEHAVVDFKKIQPPVLVEVMGGHTSTLLQLVLTKKFKPGSRFGFFNLTSYDIDYDEFSPHSYIVQTIASYDIAKGFNVGAGANLKSFGGFKPLVSASYSFFNRNIGVFIQPSYELSKDGEFEVFSFLEIHPHNEKKVQFYGRLQLLTAWHSGHALSYHGWRVGMQYKNFRFGPALNVKYIGKDPITQSNVGAFFNFLIKG